MRSSNTTDTDITMANNFWETTGTVIIVGRRMLLVYTNAYSTDFVWFLFWNKKNEN